MSEKEYIQTLKDTNKHLHEMIETKNKEIELLRTQCSQFEHAYLQLASKYSNLTLMNSVDDRGATSTSSIDLQAEIEKLKKENCSLRKSLEKEKTEKADLMEQLRKSERSLQEMVSKTKLVMQKMNELKAKESLPIQSNLSQEREDDSYAAQLSSLKESNEKLVQECQKLNKILIEEKTKVRQYEHEIQDYRSLLAESQKKLAELHVENEELYKDNTMLRVKIESLEQETSSLNSHSK